MFWPFLVKRTSLKLKTRLFFHEVLTSTSLKKFSKGRRKPCKVSRRYTEARALQRTNSRGHATSESFFIWKKLSYLVFLPKSRPKGPPLRSKYAYFFMKSWLQNVLNFFSKVVGSHVRYLRGTMRPGLHNAPTLVVIRPQNPFLFAKNGATWHFWQNQGQKDLPSWSKKGYFSWSFDFKTV